MEDVLAVYTRPHDPDYPLVCLDETSKQLIAETRTPIPMKPRTPGPLRLRVRAQRHRQPVHDVCAARRLAPCQGHGSPHRRGLRSRLERSGRSSTSRTPRPSCWSRTISTSTARRHSTKPFRPPKPDGWSSASNGTTRQSTAVGSIWRNPNSASSPSQCLDRRIPDKQTLIEEIAAWEHDRNANHTKADWQFTTQCSRQT